MRYLTLSVASAFTLSLLFIIGCGSDPDLDIDLYEVTVDDEEVEDGDDVLIDPEDFEVTYRFDCQPHGCQTECRYEDDDWFDCESPQRLTPDSEEHDVEEGYVNFDVRAVDEEEQTQPDSANILLRFDFEFALDDAEEYDEDADEPAFYFPMNTPPPATGSTSVATTTPTTANFGATGRPTIWTKTSTSIAPTKSPSTSNFPTTSWSGPSCR